MTNIKTFDDAVKIMKDFGFEYDTDNNGEFTMYLELKYKDFKNDDFQSAIGHGRVAITDKKYNANNKTITFKAHIWGIRTFIGEEHFNKLLSKGLTGEQALAKMMQTVPVKETDILRINRAKAVELLKAFKANM